MSRPNPFVSTPEKEVDRFTNFLFEEIEFFSESNPDFDMTFVESLKRQYEAGRTLSTKQLDALENIYEKWVNK